MGMVSVSSPPSTKEREQKVVNVRKEMSLLGDITTQVQHKQRTHTLLYPNNKLNTCRAHSLDRTTVAQLASSLRDVCH